MKPNNNDNNKGITNDLIKEVSEGATSDDDKPNNKLLGRYSKNIGAKKGSLATLNVIGEVGNSNSGSGTIEGTS